MQMEAVTENRNSSESPINVESDKIPIVQLEQKQKKRKAKLLDHILRELPQDISENDKLMLMAQKYQDVVQSQKDMPSKIKQYESAITTVRNERDQLQGERNRLILQKDKLETLCRELQKQSKVIQEESLARNRAEEEKRREVADHFQTSITGIQTQLNEYQSRNQDLRRENQELAEKLGQFIKQHERREEHVKKIIQARDLEVKLSEAKQEKAQCLLDQERITNQQRVLRAEEESKLMLQRFNMHLEVENKQKEQIEFYKTKYQTFNKTITQSNRLFEDAKSEMEKLGRRVKQSERDVVEWRGKWELSQRSLLEVVTDHKKQAEEAAASRKLAERLGGLCRALQAQLNDLRNGSGAATAADATVESTEETEVCDPLQVPASNEVPDEQGDGSDERHSPLVVEAKAAASLPDDTPTKHADKSPSADATNPVPTPETEQPTSP